MWRNDCSKEARTRYETGFGYIVRAVVIYGTGIIGKRVREIEPTGICVGAVSETGKLKTTRETGRAASSG